MRQEQSSLFNTGLLHFHHTSGFYTSTKVIMLTFVLVSDDALLMYFVNLIANEVINDSLDV